MDRSLSLLRFKQMPRKIVLEPNGPAVIDGGVLVTADREIELEEGVDCLLCRCGGTKNAPFCDGSHKGNRFDSVIEGPVDYQVRTPKPIVDDQTLIIEIIEDGPIDVRGDLEVLCGERVVWRGAHAKLCRCGRTAKSGFCDGSHKR